MEVSSHCYYLILCSSWSNWYVDWAWTYQCPTCMPCQMHSEAPWLDSNHPWHTVSTVIDFDLYLGPDPFPEDLPHSTLYDHPMCSKHEYLSDYWSTSCVLVSFSCMFAATTKALSKSFSAPFVSSNCLHGLRPVRSCLWSSFVTDLCLDCARHSGISLKAPTSSNYS